MDEPIFRRKSIDKVSSPEQLNDYIRVSNPSVWIILTAIILILAGVLVWGIFGRLDTQVIAASECIDGEVICYVKEADIERVEIGAEFSVDGMLGTITDIGPTPVAVTDDMDPYLVYIGGLARGEWMYVVTGRADVKDGFYTAQITTESIRPISFVLN